MNDLDYLYRISYLVRTKIINLDKLETMTKAAINLRAKLMKINYKLNKKIRDISISHIINGTSKFNIQEDNKN